MDETQSSLVGQNLRVLPRNLRAEDGDRGINAPVVYSFDSTGGQLAEMVAAANGEQPLTALDEPASIATAGLEQYLHLNPTSGELRLIRQWPLAGANSPLTLVVRATQVDNRDRYALTTLTIVRSAAAAAAAATTAAAAATTAATVNGGQWAGESANRQHANGSTSGGFKRGIEFQQERLVVQVAEDTAVNERIARVRAHHLQALATTSNSSQIPTTADSANTQLAARGRPINYQILDDQTDQFAINGLGEIFLKRALDFEQRQEFRFRVLATYTKFSDICHVQVLVLNANDNRPKVSFREFVGWGGRARGCGSLSRLCVCMMLVMN